MPRIGLDLENIQVDDFVILRHNAMYWTKAKIEGTYRKTHVIVNGVKYRRSDGRAVGVRQDTTEWYYTGIEAWDEDFFNRHQANPEVQAFIKKHNLKVEGVKDD